MRYRSLDLNLLGVLQALLIDPNVSRVARALHVGQPALSAALARLRRHFGDELFVYTNRRLVPTDFALSLQAPLQEWLARAEAVAMAQPGFDPGTAQRRFTLVCSESVAGFVLPRVSRRLLQQAPGISLSAIALSSVRGSAQPVTDAFARQGIDMVALPATLAASEFAQQSLYSVPYLSLVSADQAAGPPGDLAWFQAATHVVATAFDGRLPALAADSAYADLQVGVQTEHLLTVPAMVSATRGVATLPDFIARAMAAGRDDLRTMPSPAPWPPFGEVLQWRHEAEDDPAGQWMRQVLLACAAEVAVSPALP